MNVQEQKTAKRFGRRYPWAKWFASGCFVLRRGIDFDCMPHGMAQMIRNVASMRGLRVSVRIEEDAIHVRVTGVPCRG